MEGRKKLKATCNLEAFIKAFDNQKLDVREKKTVQKKGVVYTPEPVARYIIQCALRNYIREKRSYLNFPGEDFFQDGSHQDFFKENLVLKNALIEEIKEIKILDPSCGSGIFLVQAAEKLFQLYNMIMPGRSNLEIKKRIVKNSIFGVEIDKKAYQVSKLRLMSWMLNNDESHVDFKGTKIDFGSLNLIDGWQEFKPNIYNVDFLLHFSSKHEFDLIVGNPPYIENKKMENKEYKKKLVKKFSTAYKLYDYSILFIEKALNLVKLNGQVCYVLTNKFLAADYGTKIREMILNESIIKEIINISSLPIFIKSAAYPVIIFLKKTKQGGGDTMKVKNIDKLSQLDDPTNLKSQELSLSMIKKLPMNVIPISGNLDLITRLHANFNSLSESIKDLKIIYRPFGFLDWEKNFKHISTKKNSESDLVLIGTGNVGKYHILFDKRIKIAKRDLEIQYFQFNDEYREIWQELIQEKLIFREIAKKLTFVYDPGIFTNITGLYFLRIPSFDTDDLFALMSILNSELMDVVFKTLFGTLHMSAGYLRFNGSFIKRLPIPQRFPKSLSRLGKIMQFLSQLNHDLPLISRSNLIKMEDLDSWLNFYVKLTNSLVLLLYLNGYPLGNVIILQKLLHSEKPIPDITIKYNLPRFDLINHGVINDEELNSHLIKIRDFYHEFCEKVKSEMDDVNKFLKYNYLY